MKKLYFFLMIGAVLAGGTVHGELADAVYRDGVIVPWPFDFSGKDYHAAMIYRYSNSTSTRYVIHAEGGSWGTPNNVKTASWDTFLDGNPDDIDNAKRCDGNPSYSIRDTIIDEALDQRNASYWTQTPWAKWMEPNSSPSSGDGYFRCDGLVEYCYEQAGRNPCANNTTLYWQGPEYQYAQLNVATQTDPYNVTLTYPSSRDPNNPTISGSSSITLRATGSDTHSGLAYRKPYEYWYAKYVNGSWTAWTEYGRSDSSSQTLTILSPNTVYAWGVHVLDNDGNYTASPAYYFKYVPNQAPNTPYNEYPDDGAAGVSRTADLDWSCSDPDGNTIYYTVYFEKNDSTPNDIIKDDSTGSSANLGTLDYDSHYYWKVVADDHKGGVTTGPTWDFRTQSAPNQAPNTPYNADPYDGATGISRTADLDWSCTDPNGDTVYYTVYFEKNDSTPDNIIKNDQTGSSGDLGTLDYNSHYYWKVVANDHKGGVTTGPVWDFWTENETTRIIRLTGDLAFGDVEVGSTAQRTLTIYNDGNSTLGVSGISYPSRFSGSWSGIISAGGSRNVTVTFAPTAATSCGGTITVSSDKTGGTNTRSCSGAGTTEPTYTLTVNNGYGDGSYTGGQQRTITADSAPSGQMFDKWTGDTSHVADVNASSTTVTMPAQNITVTAIYKDESGSSPGTVQFKSSSYSVSENGGSVRVTVSRTGGSDGVASVQYATANGSAGSGSDYSSRSGTLSWSDGSSSDRHIDIPIANDSTPENSETFRVTLSSATGASLSSPNLTTVTITGPNDQPPPAGTVTTNTYDLSRLCKIWDLSGTYDEDVLGISFTMAQDGKGKIVGGGSWSAVVEGISVNATFTIKAKMKAEKDGSTSLKLQMKHTGTASQGGQTHKFKASQKIVCIIDPDDLEMRGQVETSLSMAGQKVKQIDVFSEDLPIGMDGSAMLTIETQRDAKGKIIGSGSCELSNLEELSFVVKGKPNSKTGTVKLSLKGRKETGDSGAKIQMEVFGDYQDIESMKGKVMGQTILVD